MYYGYIINNRYTVRKTLGSGGNSTVYLAYDSKLDKYWAIKQCNTLIENEIMALKSINHFAFPRIIDICTEDGLTFIVMDYIEGETLSSYMKKHRETESQIMIWARKIANALSYLHNMSPCLIYMDLKPDNIIVTPSKDLRLIDMGSIYVCDKNYVNKVSGTKYYSSEESLSGLVDINSDIYAFGMTLYELLNGSKKEYRDASGNLSLRKRNRHISKYSEYIVRKCTYKNKLRRYQCVGDIIEDLKRKSAIQKSVLVIKSNLNTFVFRFIDIFFKIALGSGVIANALLLSSSNELKYLLSLCIFFIILMVFCFQKSTFVFETRKEVLRTSYSKFIICLIVLSFSISPLRSHAKETLPLNVTLYDNYGRKLLVRKDYTLSVHDDLYFSIDLDEVSKNKTTIIISLKDETCTKEYSLNCIQNPDMDLVAYDASPHFK